MTVASPCTVEIEQGCSIVGKIQPANQNKVPIHFSQCWGHHEVLSRVHDLVCNAVSIAFNPGKFRLKSICASACIGTSDNVAAVTVMEIAFTISKGSIRKNGLSLTETGVDSGHPGLPGSPWQPRHPRLSQDLNLILSYPGSPEVNFRLTSG